MGATLFAGVAGATSGDDHLVSICHRTSSDTNEFVLITVDVAAVSAHFDNHGDFFPVGGGCSGEE